MNAGGEVVSHSDDIFVVGDRNRITQVISNLLDNALKFTLEGVVSVDVAGNKKQEVQDHQEEGIVTVKDTGPGIHPEIFPRLFTKFILLPFLQLHLEAICLSIPSFYISDKISHDIDNYTPDACLCYIVSMDLICPWINIKTIGRCWCYIYRSYSVNVSATY